MIAIFSPTSALTSVDFPTFGRPTTDTNPVLTRHPPCPRHNDPAVPVRRDCGDGHESGGRGSWVQPNLGDAASLYSLDSQRVAVEFKGFTFRRHPASEAEHEATDGVKVFIRHRSADQIP